MTSLLALDLQVRRYGAEKRLKRFHFRNNICFSYCPCTLFTPREPQVSKMQSNVCNDVHPDEFVPVSWTFNQRSHSTVFHSEYYLTLLPSVVVVLDLWSYKFSAAERGKRKDGLPIRHQLYLLWSWTLHETQWHQPWWLKPTLLTWTYHQLSSNLPAISHTLLGITLYPESIQWIFINVRAKLRYAPSLLNYVEALSEHDFDTSHQVTSRNIEMA